MNIISMDQNGADYHGDDRLRAVNGTALIATASACDFTVPATSPAEKFGTTPIHLDSIPLSCPTA